MGVVNVTPDSFSDGGRARRPRACRSRTAGELLAEGADILDVGGESTRPGATRPVLAEELDRVVPVIEALAADGATVSVDTMRSEVAARAIAAGAQHRQRRLRGPRRPGDPRRRGADRRRRYVAMHWRAHSDHHAAVHRVRRRRGPRRGRRAGAAGRRRSVRPAWPTTGSCSTPGWASPSSPEHNWELLRHLDQVAASASRCWSARAARPSSAALLEDDRGEPRPVGEREAAGVALTALLAAAWAARYVWCLRVHDRARRIADALAVAAQWSAHAADRAAGARGARPPMTDELSILGIECFAHHGVFDHERRDGQVFMIDLVLGVDARPAAAPRRPGADRGLRRPGGPGRSRLCSGTRWT